MYWDGEWLWWGLVQVSAEDGLQNLNLTRPKLLAIFDAGILVHLYPVQNMLGAGRQTKTHMALPQSVFPQFIYACIYPYSHS